MSFEPLPGEDRYKAEQRRWNTLRSQGGTRPDSMEEFPKMLYRASRRPNGGPFLVIDPLDEQWSMRNCKTVGNREEEERAIRNGEGWRHTLSEAIEYQNALETEISNAAAERQNAEKRMGEKARAEAALVDAATFEHVPEVTPAAVAAVRKRGRPRKVIVGV